MANIQVGLQLMVIGMCLVFCVLLLLMYMMKLMSAVILKSLPAQTPETETLAKPDDHDKELAAVMAIAYSALETASITEEGRPVQITLNKN